MESIILFVIVLSIYFLPAITARGKDNYTQVLIINLFLGWTLLGWVIALAMAAKKS